MVKGFDELQYTRDREIKTLLNIQDHAVDGSALEGCTCLQGKHFFVLETNSEEGATITDREKEKEFYRLMAPFAREARKAIVDQTFEFPKNIKVDPAPENHSSESCLSRAEVKCCGEKNPKDYHSCKCNPAELCNISVRDQ